MNAPLPARITLMQKMSSRFAVDEAKLLTTLKATAFKVKDGVVSDEQMTALMVVADQYGLNPFTKEIYAFPDKNGIVPVVSVDGWTRIINDHGALDGIEFRYAEDSETPKDGKPCPVWCEVVITRKDRSRPIVVREYLDEVYRPLGTYKDGNKHSPGPWQTHTKRFLRHKTLIQGARIAFGFAGIYDEDEAQRIIERDITPEAVRLEDKGGRPELQPYPAADFDKNFPAWEKLILAEKQSADQIIAKVSSKAILSNEQKAKINAVKKPDATDTGEVTSLLDDVKRICTSALEIADKDTAFIRLQDAEAILPEMNDENKKSSRTEIDAAIASIKARE